MDYQKEAIKIANDYGIDPNLFLNLVQVESGFDPSRVGAAGEVGLTQIMKDTGLEPGFNVTPIENRDDPLENLRFGAEYYKAMLNEFNGDPRLALMAFNAGPGRTRKVLKKEANVPKTTLKYIQKVLGGNSGIGSGNSVLDNIEGRSNSNYEMINANAVNPDNMGASGTDLEALLQSEYGALTGTSKKTQEADPAMASLLYFAKMGELASQPGSTALGAASGAFIAPAEYLADLKKPKTTGVSGSNVQKVLAAWDNGLVQYLTRDGTMVVKDATNTVYSDPTKIAELIDEANKLANKVALVAGTQEANLEGLGEGKKGAYRIAATKADTASKAIGQLTANIRNYKEGIDAINEGAQSGFFVQYLPSITEASIKLDNVINRLGLDVVGSVTFGALSAGELRMAMSTAAPTNMSPEYLKKWFEERIKAKENLLKIQQDMVRFFGAGDKTLKDYYDRVDRLRREENWRTTLELEDVDENYADGASASVLDPDDTSSDVEEITPEAEATIANISKMTDADLSIFPFIDFPKTTPSGRAVRQAWLDRYNELEEQSE